jgi:hypothetical protein
MPHGVEWDGETAAEEQNKVEGQLEPKQEDFPAILIQNPISS